MNRSTTGVVEKHRFQAKYSEDFKKHLVSASNQPESSLAAIAKEAGITLSTLYKWRARYQHHHPGPDGLLPIAIEAAIPVPSKPAKPPTRAVTTLRESSALPGAIEILLPLILPPFFRHTEDKGIGCC